MREVVRGIFRPATQSAVQRVFDATEYRPAIWHDFADSARLAIESDRIAFITDKSGNGKNATQAIATDRPFYNTYTINGYNVAHVTGSDGICMGAGTTSARTCIAVFEFSNTSAGEFVFPGCAASEAIELHWRPSSGGLVSFDGDQFGQSSGRYAVNAGALSASGSNITGTGTVGPGNYCGTAIFDANFDLIVMYGREEFKTSLGSNLVKYAETIWFDRELTETERNQVERGLMRKWGIG